MERNDIMRLMKRLTALMLALLTLCSVPAMAEEPREAEGFLERQRQMVQ